MKKEELDIEWVELIVEARNKGMTKEDILLFLHDYKKAEIFK